MNGLRLTRRGKILLGILIAVVAYLVFAAALDAVTPAECKVPVESMSGACKRLVFG